MRPTRASAWRGSGRRWPVFVRNWRLDRTTLAWIRTTLTMATFGFGMVGFFRSLSATSPSARDQSTARGRNPIRHESYYPGGRRDRPGRLVSLVDPAEAKATRIARSDAVASQYYCGNVAGHRRPRRPVGRVSGMRGARGRTSGASCHIC